jgi:YbbR domain-containing protein
MRPWLTSPTGLKVIALVLATITWFFVKAVTSDSRVVEGVPLEVKVRPGLQAGHASTRSVNVTVRGTTEDLRQASRFELFAVLDMTREDAPGRYQVPLDPRDIRHPRRIRVMAVDPTNIVVRIEKTTE